jgi:FMN reductase
MKTLIIQTNLAPGSRNAYLSELLSEDLGARGIEAGILDLAHTPLPFCDGAACYKDERVVAVTEMVTAAEALVWSSPIYNYDLNAAAKNFLELTNAAWSNKVVGFLIQAGGARSYMAPMAFANSLMLDHRCRIIPRFVYIERSDFVDRKLEEDGEPRKRVTRLAEELISFTSTTIPEEIQL